MSKATKSQIVKIHVGKNQLRLSDEEYRKMLLVYGVSTSKDLTEEDADHLINVRFKKMGFVLKNPKRSRHLAGEVFHHKSSLRGLRDEITEYAQRRFGTGWERPLGALAERISGIERMEWIHNFYHLKEIKAALLRLESSGPYVPGERKKVYVPAQGDPF